MKKLALCVAVVVVMTVAMSGCSDRLPLDQASRAMILHYARVYLAGNLGDFAKGMTDRGWDVPASPDEWERYADDFGYCIEWVFEHGGPPPPPTTPVEVRSRGAARDPVEAFGGVGQ